MPRKRIRLITKKQKVTEAQPVELTSLEQVVREPTFMRGRRRPMPTHLQLPFVTSEQSSQQTPHTDNVRNTKPEETSSREAFSYERPSGTVRNDGTYRIPGATDATDNQVYRSTTESTIDEDRRDRFNPLASSDANRLRDTSALSSQKQQDRYQTSQTYQSSTNQAEKKNTKELERSKF